MQLNLVRNIQVHISLKKLTLQVLKSRNFTFYQCLNRFSFLLHVKSYQNFPHKKNFIGRIHVLILVQLSLNQTRLKDASVA